ncbi:leucine-rich repeat protein [Gordonibacter sp.]|uniref:leucine-rich repeat protein n=1 Tax=Gordonibacter sp. TaxID=1968902 RepID=UPI002FCACCF5
MWAVGLDDNAAVTVALHPDGTLEVQGVGKTVAFKEVEKVDGAKSITTPWLAEGYADRIKRVKFESTVEPESLAYWFDGCKNLEEVGDLPVSAKDLTAAFRNCTSLIEAPALPEKAETIASVFEGCEKLEKAAVIPSSVETVSAAFKGCVALQQAPSIPTSVKDMSAAFSGCSVLTTVPQIEGAPKKMDQAFFDCPAITIVPEAFAFTASCKACFGFSGTTSELLKTVYNGSDKIVLAYDWTADGRVLVDADGVKRSEAAEGDSGNADDTNGAAGKEDNGADGEDVSGQKSPEGAINDAGSSPNEEPVVQDPYDPSQAQVNITVPSSVPLLLGSNGPNSASIPVSIENRSDAAVKIVGARLKRSDIDYPGGSWSLVSPASDRHFVDDARFTPMGLEAMLDTPVGLPANSGVINLVWEGFFTDYGIKTLLSAAASSDGSFTYGTLIWHVEVV